MGWIISLVMLVIGCTNGNEWLIVTSGLYAIAGSLGGAANIVVDGLKASAKITHSFIDNDI